MGVGQVESLDIPQSREIVLKPGDLREILSLRDRNTESNGTSLLKPLHPELPPDDVTSASQKQTDRLQHKLITV